MRTLAWEKWISPLEKNLDKIDPELVDTIKQRIKDRDDGDPDNHFWGDLRIRDELNGIEDDSGIPLIEGINLKNKTYKILVNPFGLHVATEQVLPNTAFNFWIGHTNFDIDTKVFKTIDDSAGVESLELYSRYRFRIGIGKQFKTSEVFSGIEKALEANGVAGTTKPSISDIYISDENASKLNKAYKKVSKYPFWAIYVLPNENIEVAHSNSAAELANSLELFQNTQLLVGGQIVSS